ncbi:MAG TPA: crotonase/enoyl-CoA hydratase family protein, partial [Nevskiaceae bacterium]|nr:crotonase/enoyl-CoA hydratase family protein [Nevskiaceae bacterium]
EGPVTRIGIMRQERRNAINRAAAEQLADAFRHFDEDDSARVAILHGEGEHFCAGADLTAVASGDAAQMNRLDMTGDGPMGPTRMQLSKPVIAAVSGYCVAGGLELALWCDLRVADETAVFGVFCRRFGVPLIDGGTVRLPRLIGMSRALDMILTGRAVDAREAASWALVNRLVPKGHALAEAQKLATELAALPQTCMRNDRHSAYTQWGLSESEAIAEEFRLGLASLASGEAASGSARFTSGDGRHGGSLKP